MHRIRVLLVDDNKGFRKTLKSILLSEPDINIISEAEDGLEAIIKARKFGPDLILMDINMPEVNGIETTRRLANEMPRMKIIILGTFDIEAYRSAANNWGANGYVVKKLIATNLIPAIKMAFKTNEVKS